MAARTLAFIAALAASLLTPDVGQAFNSSAWTRPQNQLWTMLSFGRVVAGEQHLPDGRRVPFIQALPDQNTFVDESFYLQAEYGVTDWLTLNASLPYKQIFIERESFFTQTQAPGNLYFGTRLGVFEVLELRLPVVWSVEIGVWIPTGYTRNFAPSVGAGNVDFDVETAVGGGFRLAPWLPMYAQVGGGIRARTNSFAFSNAVECADSDVNCVIDSRPNFGDELMYLAELGATPLGGSVLVFGKLLGNYSLLEPEVGFTARNPIPTRQRFVKVGLGGFLYPLRFFGVKYGENVGLGAQYFSTIDGQNVPRTDDLFVGIEYKHQF
jgi:hypothetical protein